MYGTSGKFVSILLTLACATLQWDAPEPGLIYDVRRDGVVLGATTATTFDVGCGQGIYDVTARDVAGNISEPTYYWEFGPCAIGCEVECVEFGPGGKCRAWDLPPNSSCCRSLTGLP